MLDNNYKILPLISAIALSACMANSRWLDGGMMSFKVRKIDLFSYNLIATGSGSQTQTQVKHGFLVRAAELCKGAQFDHTETTESYSYRDGSGMLSFVHYAYKVSGTVTCKYEGELKLKMPT